MCSWARRLRTWDGGVNELFYPTIGWWPSAKAPINRNVRLALDDTPPQNRSGVHAETTREHGDIPRRSASDRRVVDLTTR
jgi:hypothetical protein